MLVLRRCMDERLPNSKRYWRLNSLTAIWLQLPLGPPRDPEEQYAQRELRNEFLALQHQEAAVRARYASLQQRRLDTAREPPLDRP